MSTVKQLICNPSLNLSKDLKVSVSARDKLFVNCTLVCAVKTK